MRRNKAGFFLGFAVLCAALPLEGSAESMELPEISAESTIFGSADTHNKSTLKEWVMFSSGPGGQHVYYYDENGVRQEYPEDFTGMDGEEVSYTGEAIIRLEMEGLDDALIDSSSAVVSLAEGDGYYVDELILNADKLEGSWQDGEISYTLSEGDLEWNMGDYPLADSNSGREWSVFGGDGNGCYTFYFEVSGILYNGEELPAVQFPVQVYIYGRDGTGRAEPFNEIADPEAVQSESGQTPGTQIQWIWQGDGEKPVLCDALADDFYSIWPEGTDTSGIDAGDVTVTLETKFGETLTLLPEEQFSVFSAEQETQIAVTYMQWSYTPVYTKMTISVQKDGLEAENTYDVASVYVYMVQQGGGGTAVDGTVMAYSYYGFENLEDAAQILSPCVYTLTQSVKEGEETIYTYYAEDEDGNAYMTENREEAMTWAADGEDGKNLQVIGNTAYATTRLQTEEVVINGETITLDRTYEGGEPVDAQTAEANGLKAADGYAIGETITPYEMWAWQNRFLAGYTQDKEKPDSFPYVNFPYGF